MTRWESAIVDVAPPLLRELVGCLRELDAVTNETNNELRAALLPAAESSASSHCCIGRSHQLSISKRLPRQ
jgi:hypothetical protein